MKFIMVRHGETKANNEGRYIGHTESPYTDKGMYQVENIITRIITDINIEEIYSSQLYRTNFIANKIADRLDKKVMIEPDICEMNFGIFEGKKYEEIQKEHSLEWENWTRDYVNYRIPKGESLKDVYYRVENFIDKLKEKGNSETVYLLVTHGGIIQTIMTYLLDLNIDDRWHFKVPPGAIIEIDYNDDYGILSKLVY
ncbi:histidine phosphatase family protein [Clostridium sp. D2Q-14]|uniref:histidine phosphatase family protein n=1 Tax=Anaeromonas gelatinilytica TaxID=2683194 RepID=UPI00193C19E0|nr:histidine phosphatase family protein [Anaeromonas gelatinilytica]MBS4535495.1 histidine phosphatase family protein [Anaeromonas gelatinilytica]